MGFFSDLRLRLRRAEASPPAELPEITAEMEAEGFVDLDLRIQEHRLLPDSTQSIRAAGMHRGERVAIEVLLGAAWKQGKLGEDVPLVTYQGEVRYRSAGAQSDALVRVLDELYETKLGAKKMAKEAVFTAITLGGDPRDLDAGPVHLKLFIDSADEEQYAELYTNVDLAAQRLEIHEKDPEYRAAVMRALAAKAR